MEHTQVDPTAVRWTTPVRVELLGVTAGANQGSDVGADGRATGSHSTRQENSGSRKHISHK